MNKNQQYSQRFFKLYQLFMKIIYAKLSRNSHFIYYPNTYYLTNPILCYYPPQLIYLRDLHYTVRINLILWSNLNYKNLYQLFTHDFKL